MEKAKKFIAECGSGLGSIGQMRCGGGEYVQMSKQAYEEYKERLKASSMFKTNESANQALLNVVNVQIPKAIDGIKKLVKNKNLKNINVSRVEEDLDKLKSLNSISLYSNKGHDLLMWIVYDLGSFRIDHYSLMKTNKKLSTLISKISAFEVQYRKYKKFD